MKTQIYNLIIIDESGSMHGVSKQTISGCNETLNTIRVMQKKFEDCQEHFVSIFAFQGVGSNSSRYIIKNEPISSVMNITAEDYVPSGSTPLFDAVGRTLTDLKAINNNVDSIGSVTIITDGYENSSTRYDLQTVAKMIDALKEIGWNFNFIGANIDVDHVSRSLNIDNAMSFKQDDAGTEEMFFRERNSRMAYYNRLRDADAELYNMSSNQSEMTDEEFELMRRRRTENRRNANNGCFEQ